MRRLSAGVVAAVGFLAACAAYAQEEAAEFYKKNCMSCHTIGGGRLTGPDLKDVAARRDAAWLKRFIANPKGVIDSGDAAAAQLLQEYRGVVMPTVPDLNPSRIEALLRLIEAESKLPRSRFAGMESMIPERPFTDAEIRQGHDLFIGVRPLKNGGPACLSCHAVQGIGALGGGRLGPDLTGAFVKMEGRKGLAAWLSAPATPTMQPVYKRHPLDADPPAAGGPLNEVVSLVAYLEKVAKDPPSAEGATQQLNFILLGLFGTAGSLVLFDFLWRGRFRGVRRSLVKGSREGEPS